MFQNSPILHKSSIFHNFPIFQDSLVTWGVQRKDTIDLLTVGNTTFTGDNRYSVQFQNPTDWVLRYSTTYLGRDRLGSQVLNHILGQGQVGFSSTQPHTWAGTDWVLRYSTTYLGRGRA